MLCMVALLAHHNKFIWVPEINLEDAEMSCRSVEEKVCPAWQNDIFTADGSSIPLFQKPNYFSDTYYDRKAHYSMNW